MYVSIGPSISIYRDVLAAFEAELEGITKEVWQAPDFEIAHENCDACIACQLLTKTCPPLLVLMPLRRYRSKLKKRRKRSA